MDYFDFFNFCSKLFILFFESFFDLHTLHYISKHASKRAKKKSEKAILLFAKDFQENYLKQKILPRFLNILNFFYRKSTEKSQKKNEKVHQQCSL